MGTVFSSCDSRKNTKLPTAEVVIPSAICTELRCPEEVFKETIAYERKPPSPELFNSCINGNIIILKDLLSQKKYQDMVNVPYFIVSKRYTSELFLIQIAFMLDRYDIAELLIQNGADTKKLFKPLPIATNDLPVDESILIHRFYQHRLYNGSYSFTKSQWIITTCKNMDQLEPLVFLILNGSKPVWLQHMSNYEYLFGNKTPLKLYCEKIIDIIQYKIHVDLEKDFEIILKHLVLKTIIDESYIPYVIGLNEQCFKIFIKCVDNKILLENMCNKLIKMNATDKYTIIRSRITELN